MIVNYPLLLVAVLVLWLPRQWLNFGSKSKRRRPAASSRAEKDEKNAREAGDQSVSMRSEFAKFRNYVDLIRAAAGSLALTGGLGVTACVSVADGASRSATIGVIGLRAAILLVGVLSQAIRWEQRGLTFFPPIFYLAGVSVGLCGYRAAGLAFVLIWALNAAFANAAYFLSAYAVLIAGFGILLSGPLNVSPILAGCLCFLPTLLSLLANRPLVVFSRRPSRSSE